MSPPLAIDTIVRLRSGTNLAACARSPLTLLPPGYELPLLGLGVYLNNDAKPASLAALKAGYRYERLDMSSQGSADIPVPWQSHRLCPHVRERSPGGRGRPGERHPAQPGLH